MLPAFPGMKVAHDRMARLRSSCAAKESTRHHAMQLARSSNATGERCRKARMHFALAPSPFFGAFRHTPFIRLMASSAERRMQRPPILVTQYPSACTSQPEPTAIRGKRMWGASARMRNISCSGGGDNEAVKSRDGRPRRLGPGISCGRETESTLTACGQKGKGKGKGKKKNERAHSIVLSKLVRAPHVATAYSTNRKLADQNTGLHWCKNNVSRKMERRQKTFRSGLYFGKQEQQLLERVLRFFQNSTGTLRP